jgi:hypothetical protein
MSKHYTSDAQIEGEAEWMMTQLDAAFLAEGSEMTVEEYHHHSDEIELWVKLRLRELR